MSACAVSTWSGRRSRKRVCLRDSSGSVCAANSAFVQEVRRTVGRSRKCGDLDEPAMRKIETYAVAVALRDE
jgi:hypothetical protein